MFEHEMVVCPKLCFFFFCTDDCYGEPEKHLDSQCLNLLCIICIHL